MANLLYCSPPPSFDGSGFSRYCDTMLRARRRWAASPRLFA